MLEETIARCREANLEVVLLPTWYDVDDAADPRRTQRRSSSTTIPAFATIPGYPAPHTRELLLAMQFDPAAVTPA